MMEAHASTEGEMRAKMKLEAWVLSTHQRSTVWHLERAGHTK